MVYTGIHIEWLNMVDNVQSSDHGGFTIRNGEDHRQTWGFEFEPINNGHQLSEFKARMTGLFIQPVCRGFYWKPTIMTGGHYHCKSPHVFVDETGTFDHGVGTWCFFIWGVWKWGIERTLVSVNPILHLSCGPFEMILLLDMGLNIWYISQLYLP